jgi:Fe-S cluster assembly protein SufD
MDKIIIKTSDREIIIPDRKEVLLVDNLDFSEGGRRTAGRDLRIVIGQYCRVQYVSIMAGPADPEKEERREMILGDHSRLDSYRVYLGSGGSRMNFINRLGREAELDSRVFFYQRSGATLESQDNYIFAAPDSRGRFSVTGLLSGTASAKYYSDIVIDPAAQGTDSRIDMKLYLLDPGAKGTILPGLKIAANEVKAGHGASTFQLSPENLFYLRGRGLSEAQAKSLVINSLAARFTDGLLDKSLKEAILRQISGPNVL